MGLTEVLGGTLDAVTVRRVFGEPYERDGVTVIPAARVLGGGGGGEGQGPGGQGEGTGGGFGLVGRPVGAFVVKDGRVTWRPALDVNRLLLVAGLVAAVGLCSWARAHR